MITDKLHGKTRQLGDYILEQIYTGQYVPSSAIPSIRSYMEQFDMPQRTVQRTLEILVGQGVLESHHGRGTFVKLRRQDKKAGVRTISVVLSTSRLETSIYGNIFLGLQRAAFESGCQLKVDHVPNVVDADDMADIAGRNQWDSLVAGTSGLIILSEQDDRLKNNKLPIPVVGVCMYDNYNDVASLLDLDPFSSAGLAVAYFKKHGVEKVYIFSADISSYRMRGKVFAEQWRDQGGECKISEISHPVTKVSAVPAHSALLFTTGGLKEEFLRCYCKQTGIRLEEKSVILELDGKSRLNPDYIKTPCIAPDWKQVGRMALEEILYRANSPGIPPRRIFVPGRLYEE